MGSLPSPLTIFISIATLLLFSSPCKSAYGAPMPNETDALTRFRLQTDAHGILSGNWTSGDACSASWRGVGCINGRVTLLSLPSLDLRGPIDTLSGLDDLRILDLHSNRLNGSILPLANCTNLKLLYLSGNDFSGEIPGEIASLKHLLRLDISDNNLKGVIPVEISQLTHLMTIRLQDNVLSGQVPDFSAELPDLKDLNFSNNLLTGKLPNELQKRFGDKSFAGNAALCGSSPFPDCSLISSPTASAQTVVPSNPSSLPTTTAAASPALKQRKGWSHKGLGTGAIVAIVLGNVVALLLVVSFVVAYYCGRYVEHSEANSKAGSDKGRNYSSHGGGGDSDGTSGNSDRSKLVFIEKRTRFELEDLLRASAELLGKGNLGTVYKAVLEDGSTVAVKRLKDANPCARREFEQYMDVIGKLRHPNIVPLRAYYYAKEEKLLVYDYLPNGSLHSLLHGNRGPGRVPLDWTTRISLALGAARGLAQVHEEYNMSKIPHGNVKSSNVLVDKNGVACISDFGLALLLNPIHVTARLGGYRAPEQVETKKLSQKADVYSFGVLLLELLTARPPSQSGHQDDMAMDLPKWVRSVVRDEWTAEVFDPELLRYKNIEEEMVAMLQVAMACVTQQPDKRPNMLEVVKMIQDIRVEQSPLGEDLESRSSLSPSLAATDDAMTNF
ncbi:hypothetical protein Scep_005342 [Stephania cephalantha]|uniref:Protein kinase domain-containing protein n=1 Tax=Stephania cephalantha TaxID=152367 RepID=A0AAP0PW96_9MAGN